MKKLLAAAIGILVVVSVGALAYQMGWLAPIGLGSPAQPVTTPGTAPTAGAAVEPGAAPAAPPGPTSPASPAQQEPAGGGAPGAPGAPEPPGGGAPAAGQRRAEALNTMPRPAPPTFDGNVAALDWGGFMERPNHEAAFDLFDGDQNTVWRLNAGEQAIVISFYEHEPVVIDRVVIVSGPGRTPTSRPVEISTSMAGPKDTDFVAAPTTGTASTGGESAIAMASPEARFVRVRFPKVDSNQGDMVVSEIRVIEGQRAGYIPLITRHQELTWMPPPAGPDAIPPAPGTAAATGAGAATGCAPLTDSAAKPGRSESRKVLAVGDIRDFPAASYRPDPRPGGNRDLDIYSRLTFTKTHTRRARPWMLSAKYGYDTVALEQVCEKDKRSTMSPVFKRALLDWVAAGHKLILHDADKCAPGPGYDWLPYRLKTNNPGAKAAEGTALTFVEDNWMAHGQPGKPGFVDVTAWVEGKKPYRNELGDSNTIVAWDPRWCGHMAVANINNVFGFVEAYAHYGRGLIIYNGFDIDLYGTFGYDELVARELAQGIDPDNLPCSARLGSFIVKTDGRLANQRMATGQAFTYPLTLLPNQGYKGRVTLSLATNPPVAGVQAKFEPATVDVSATASSTLTVTIPPGAPEAMALTVKGSDAAGTEGWLCLFLSPPTSGTLSIESTLAPPAKAQKNLEIILDGSGSMKTAMGQKSRWQTALDVLDQVVSELPDTFNVGLRIYGHREPSTSKKTCTDTQLVVPVRRLNRAAITAAATRAAPRGETPLVYSVLQAPGDLKAIGGGTVILITDGEESCGGDAAKAAEELKASGVDVRLNIVGFALGGKTVQKTLTSFAESTGGRFYTAQSGATLAQALIVATIDKLPFKVYDAAGKEVAGGEAGGPGIDLPAGEYKVVVKAGTQQLVAERVKVTLGRDIRLRVTLKENQVVIE
jgi:hypothetical protein